MAEAAPAGAAAAEQFDLQTLLNNTLLGKNIVHNAALIRVSDGKLRAISRLWFLSEVDILAMTEAFSKPDVVRQNGMKIGDTTYQTIRCDTHSYYGKKDGKGLIVVKSKSLYSVATYNERMHASVAIEAMERFGEFLREKGS